MTRAQLPVEDDAVLVPDDLGQMARVDEQVVPRARIHHGGVLHRVPDPTRDDVLTVMQRTVLEVHLGPDVPLPTPARSQSGEPDGRLAAEAEAGDPESHLRGVTVLPVVGYLVGL